MASESIEIKLYKGKVLVRFYPKSHKYFVSIEGGPFKQKSGVTTFIGIKDKSRALGYWYQQITADFLLKLIEKGIKFNHDLALEAAIQNEILSTEAKNIGTESHDWCEAFIKHHIGVPEYEKLPDMPKRKEVIIGVNSFLEWWDENHIKPIASEKIVYSLKKDYIGTLDFDAQVNKIRSLLDFKTANGLYNDVRLQTSGYKEAAEEEAGKKIYKHRWAIRLSKYTEQEYYEKEERKKELKRYIAKIKGWQFKDYEIKPYKVFEAKCLDVEKENIEMDRIAFLNAIDLYRWNQLTDFWKQEQKA